MKILIVDDHPLALRLLTAQLHSLCFDDVLACSSGAQAVRVVEQDPGAFTLVVCDLQMPGMDGVEVLRHLARLKFTGAIILLSAEDERVLQAATLLGTAHGLFVLAGLQKPVAPQDLQRALDNPEWRDAPKRIAALQGADALRLALQRDEIVNVYQPKVDVRTGMVSGVETLVRWHHPTLGVLLPDQFISTAEEHGLIDALALRVLDRALDQAQDWRDSGLDLVVAVNVSMDNLSNLRFPDIVASEAKARGIAPAMIVLEVTETRIMRDPSTALDILARVKLKRFGLAVDHFGTGHSSLGQLRDFPFDELKIDRGFVHAAGHNTSSRAIFDASCRLAHDLRMTAVAEGVEDLEDWNLVRKSACDHAQGFFIAHPMEGDAIPDWAAGWRAPE